MIPFMNGWHQSKQAEAEMRLVEIQEAAKSERPAPMPKPRPSIYAMALAIVAGLAFAAGGAVIWFFQLAFRG